MTARSGSLAASFMSLAVKAVRRVSSIARRGTYELLAAFGHEDYVRFVVLTRSRTGSNLLLSFLNSHPNIYAQGEIFARLKGTDALARLRNTFRKQPRHIKARGFKIFYYHPLDAKADELWQLLEGMKDLRVIHLKRQNILRTLLSRKIAATRHRWTGTRFDAESPDSKSVNLSFEELEEGFRRTRDWERAADHMFRAHEVLELSYEDLVRHPQESYGRLLRFLDVPPSDPHTDLRQQNPERLRELIKNYEDLKLKFEGSEWQSFFDD